MVAPDDAVSELELVKNAIDTILERSKNYLYAKIL